MAYKGSIEHSQDVAREIADAFEKAEPKYTGSGSNEKPVKHTINIASLNGLVASDLFLSSVSYGTVSLRKGHGVIATLEKENGAFTGVVEFLVALDDYDI